MKLFRATLVIILMVFLGVNYSYSQIVAPTGITTRASSQLVFYYDINQDEHVIQVTNTNDSVPVWVHVQIFRSYDEDGPSGEIPPVFCDERNFVDLFTPNDTHVYSLPDPEFPKNIGENELNPGESTSVDLSEPTTTTGFVVVTPVVSEADLSAISFQWLIGHSSSDNAPVELNSLGRDAVNLATGEILPDGTVLDGVTGGFVHLQPDELLFDFKGDAGEVDVIVYAFSDNYGPAGLLGYGVTPGEVTLTSFIFDFKEDPTSCGNKLVDCFYSSGLNDDWTTYNEQFFDDDGVLCDGASTPEYPDTGGGDGQLDSGFQDFGWTRMFVTGIDASENVIGVFYNGDLSDADYMFTRGERTPIDVEPPAEDCAVEGDEDEDGFADCLDTDCATDESCETGEEECADTMDNDEDGDTDCADLGCDGFAGCEFGEEVSCDDGIDNDADGAVDGDDTDCQAADTGGTGGDGDGGGCVVTGTVSTSSSVVNFLVLMLPFIGVFGIRRFKNKVLGR